MAAAVGSGHLLPSHRRRVEAFAIDAAVVAGVFGLALALDKLTDLPGLGLALAAALAWVYYVGATAWLMEGQSAGKTICELRVVPLFAGSSVAHNLRGLLWSLGRHTVGYIVVDVFLLGAVLALVNPHRRCLHDYAFASQVTSTSEQEDEAGRAVSLRTRYRAYWEEFAERYDRLTRRNRWFFFPWKWLSKGLIVIALLLDKVLPAKGASSAGAVPAPATPPTVISGKATAGLWVGTAALSGLVGAVAWPEQDSISSLQVVTNFGTVGHPATQEIFLMQADGSDLRQLTRNRARDGDPDLFADRRIVFDSERDGNREIYVMDADGSEQTRLTFDDGHDGCPAWSPDGTRVAFTSARDGNWNVYVMDADGSRQSRVTEDPADDWCPSWSPDGEQVAFTSNRAGYWNIYAIRLDGSDAEPITDEQAGNYEPAWSPDGTRIAFTSERDDNQNVYLVDLESGVETQVTDHPARDGNPFWAPGGETLLFGSGRDFNADEGGELYATEPDGSNQSRLTFFADCWPDTSSCDFTR